MTGGLGGFISIEAAIAILLLGYVLPVIINLYLVSQLVFYLLKERIFGPRWILIVGIVCSIVLFILRTAFYTMSGIFRQIRGNEVFLLLGYVLPVIINLYLVSQLVFYLLKERIFGPRWILIVGIVCSIVLFILRMAGFYIL